LSWSPEIELQQVLYLFLSVISIGLVLSILLFIWVIKRVKRINLPADAGPITALRATPLAVVVLLDLLDLSLDFLATPLAWTLMSYLGLLPLRGLTALWALIPGTQALPIMTLAWLVVRLGHAKANPPRQV